jgi:hypothetical protein
LLQIHHQLQRSSSPAQAALAFKQIQSSFPISSTTSHLVTSHLVASQQQHRLSQLQASIDARRSYVNQSQI